LQRPRADADKQKAIDLFLGVPDQDHAPAPQRHTAKSYIQWYSPDILEQSADPQVAASVAAQKLEGECDYWTE
jgi:hypothetical protein